MQTNLSPGDWAALAGVLADSIPTDKGREFPFRILRYLADRTRDLAAETGEPPRLATKEIYLDVGGNPNQEASAWLSPIWKSIEATTLPSIEHALIERARVRGLSHYPWVAKHAGSPARYVLEARSLPESRQAEVVRPDEQPPMANGGVRYVADLTLKPSLLGRIFTGPGFYLSWRRRLGLIGYNVVSYFGLAGLALIGLYAMRLDRSPLSVGALIDLALVLWLLLEAILILRSAVRIFEDRIVIASNRMLSIREQGATMELERIPDSDHLLVHLRRYTATCPICSNMIKLDKGEPDFRRRLVGRCSESPREHVFSFDRTTLTGKPLVTPF